MKDVSIFLQQLKNHTHDIHQKAHNLDYFKKLMKGEIEKESYLAQLYALAIVLSTLEREIQKLLKDYPNILPDGYLNKLPFLLDDIDYLSGQIGHKTIIGVIKTALEISDEIMIISVKDHVLLLGYLYILEGSLQGGEVVKEYLKKQFNLQDNRGLSYFRCYEHTPKSIWSEFKKSLDCIIVSQKKEQEIIDTSIMAFNGLIKIYSQIHPIQRSELAYHSAVFNPEAGEHLVPQDTDLIEVAKKSNEICWYRFPYFEFRYAERGYRFGLSDNLWFLTLIDVEYSLAQTQIEWIISVMAGRGMPSILLEEQLRILDTELNKIGNIQNNKYKTFLKASEYIRLKRERILEKSKVDMMVRMFKNRSDRNFNRRLRNAGSLIICSVIDEKLGYKNAKESLKSFLCDEDIFTKEWIDDVNLFYFEIENIV